MNIAHISQSAWRRFKIDYPNAYSFLLQESLQGEWESLKTKPGTLTGFKTTRLTELNGQFLDLCSKCGTENSDIEERYSFGIYAGNLCTACAMKYRDHCGIDQPQGTRQELEDLGETY